MEESLRENRSARNAHRTSLVVRVCPMRGDDVPSSVSRLRQSSNQAWYASVDGPFSFEIVTSDAGIVAIGTHDQMWDPIGVLDVVSAVFPLPTFIEVPELLLRCFDAARRMTGDSAQYFGHPSAMPVE